MKSVFIDPKLTSEYYIYIYISLLNLFSLTTPVIYKQATRSADKTENQEVWTGLQSISGQLQRVGVPLWLGF